MKQFQMYMNPFDWNRQEFFTEAQFHELFQQLQDGDIVAKKRLLASWPNWWRILCCSYIHGIYPKNLLSGTGWGQFFLVVAIV